MRCPNCGNENPPDYMFCDECGARLLGGDQAAGMPDSENEDASVGVGSTAAPAGASSSGSGIVGLPSNPSDQSGAPSYSSMGMQDSSPDMTASSASMDMGAGADAGTDMGMSSSTDNGNTQESTPPPVTEDTVQPSIPSYSYGSIDSGTGASSNDSGAAAPAPTLPDVTPISAATTPDAEAAEPYEAVPVEEGAPASAPMEMGTAQADTGAAAPISAPPAPDTSGGSWAAEALDHLKSAQQAITTGDWGGFGQAMSTLRSILESAASDASAGAASQAASLSAPAPSATSTPNAPTNMGASSSADSGASMGTWGGNAATDNGSSAPSYPSYNSGPASMDAAPAYSAPMAEPQEAQPSMSVPASTGMAGMDEGMARLVVISTGAELSLPEQEEITVGREDPSSGIFPDVDLTPYGGEDGGVSRRHARLLHIGDDYFVEDLQSTNYTKLDGQRLPAHVRERLEDGARLDFGRVAVIFRRS
jgi:pSer/pThr/pTyr-binding forkhead associated (FHA) protein